MPEAGQSRHERSAPRAKVRRAPRACDFCHRRSIRCRPSEANPSMCQNCEEYGEPCRLERPVKKRGAKPAAVAKGSASTAAPTTSLTGSHSTKHRSTQTWQAPAIASQALIMDLVEVYFEVVHPIFPFFHQPTVLRRVSRGEYHTDRSFFAVTMAMCGLAAARARDFAIFSAQWSLASLTATPSERFFSASEEAIPSNGVPRLNLDYPRAYALLAITAIQYGDPRTMRYYLGLYQTIVETDRLHDEACWPKDMGIVKMEECRRLFWSMYTLDVFTSIVWGGVVRSREAQANVAYPTAVDDDEISDAGYEHPPTAAIPTSATSPDSNVSSVPNHGYTTGTPKCWLYGWNFTTDLYRILEHVVDHFRRRRPEHRVSTHIDGIFGHDTVPGAGVLDAILNMYKALPARFKETPPASNAAEHRLNFQTANIAATIQLVRMMLFAAEEATVAQRCCVASELLQAFADVPIIYLRAISSPLLHHLAGIGSLLGSVFDKGLPESSYQQIRAVLSAMVQLLANLEVSLHSGSGARSRIQTLIDRIDEYLSARRQATGAPQHLDNGTREPALATSPFIDHNSPLFVLPPELLDDWSWAFDFTQTGT